jgi:hemerythrin-like domain-containing protein
MNLDKYKHQHVSILGGIQRLRELTHDGIQKHAEDIARGIVSMSSIIKLHLAVEDRALYPALQKSSNTDLAHMGQRYQNEMGTIAQEYEKFSRRWNQPESLQQDPEAFRRDANHVLRMVYERVQKENRDFYPRIEAEMAA